MKLYINTKLRKALLACYSTPAVLATSLSLGSLTLLSPMAQAAVTVTTGAGGQLTPLIADERGDTDDYIVINFTSGYVGGGAANWKAKDIYIANWKQTGGSTNETVYVGGDLKNGSVIDASYGNGNIEFSGAPSGAMPNEYIFDGNHKDFTGSFIQSISNAHARDFNFTNNAGNTADGETLEYIAGKGAIELGYRAAAVDGLAANATAKNANFFYTGNVGIGNSQINANAITLNGKVTSGIESANNYDSNITTAGTDGAHYTISSRLNLNALEINDGSDATLTGSSVIITNAKLNHANSTLTVNSAGAQISSLQMAGANGHAIIAAQNVNLGAVGHSVTGAMSVTNTGSMNLDGTWIYSSAIANEGNINFADTLTLDLTDAVFSNIDGVYSLNLMTGAGNLDASSWLTAEGAVDISKLSGITTTSRNFSYTDGKLEYSFAVNNLTWGGGSGTWDTTAENTAWSNGGTASAYTAGDIANFGESTSTENAISLSGEITPAQVFVDSAQNYSFDGPGSLSGATELTKSGSGTLTISMDNTYTGGTTLNAGTLRMQSMAALGTGTLEINGGSLAFYGGNDVAIDAQDITLNSGALNVALESTNATLSNGNTWASHTLNVTGSGTFTHDEWSKVSSVNVGTGATVYFNETSTGSDVKKTITGDGTIKIANTSAWGNFSMQLDASNQFSGTIELEASAKALIDIDGHSEEKRISLNLGASSDLVVTSDSTTTLFLDSLTGSGQLRFDWSPTQARHINLQITGDQTFAGTFHNVVTDSRMGNITVGSLAGQNYIFTLSGTGMSTNDTRANNANLIINNAIVQMTNNAAWNGAIRLNADSAALHFNGNEYTRAAGAGAISGNGTVQVSSTVNINNANTYTGTTQVTGGTLNVGNVGALATSEVTITAGTLNLGGLAVSNNVAAAGGSLTGFSAYTGSLSVTGNVSVAGEISSTISINSGGTLALSGSSSSTININNAGVLNLTGNSTGIISVNAGGTLNASGSITGDLDISAGGTLNLDGVWNFSQTINNADGGLINFGAGLQLNLAGQTFSQDGDVYKLTLIEGAGITDISAWLVDGAIDANNISGITTAGRDFSFADGVLS